MINSLELGLKGVLVGWLGDFSNALEEAAQQQQQQQRRVAAAGRLSGSDSSSECTNDRDRDKEKENKKRGHQVTEDDIFACVISVLEILNLALFTKEESLELRVDRTVRKFYKLSSASSTGAMSMEVVAQDEDREERSRKLKDLWQQYRRAYLSHSGRTEE